MEEKAANKYIEAILEALFVILFLFGFQSVIHVGADRYIGDIAGYIAIGDSLFSTGSFSFSTIISGFRGIYYPMYIGFIGHLSSRLGTGIEIIYYSFSSVILGSLFYFMVLFFEGLLAGEAVPGWRRLRRLFVLLFTLIFFWGLFVYPLTDLYAAMFMILSVGLFYYVAGTDNKLIRTLFLLLSGGTAYIAYNIRTIYMMGVIALLVINLFIIRSIRERVISSIKLVIGILFAAIPQMIINYCLNNRISLFVDTSGLFGQQLWWGLQYDRYETYFGGNGYGEGMYFTDDIGTLIVNECLAGGGQHDMKNYLLYFFKYPLDYVAIMGKHVFNAFFMIFPEQYITDPSKNRIMISLLSLLVVFVTILILRKRWDGSRPVKNEVLYMIPLLLPTLFILPGAVEQRFLIMPYLISFSMIATWDYRTKPLIAGKAELIKVAAAWIIFSVTSLAIESFILGGLESPVCYGRIF